MSYSPSMLVASAAASPSHNTLFAPGAGPATLTSVSMAMKWWLYLSTHWKLQDVQAGLVVIVSLTAFVAVFTSARFFWHASAARIAKNSDVPVSSLLSFTTLGEVVDVIILLKSRLFSSKYFTLAIQCLLVIAFSACAIFAGPISRFATRVGEREELRPNHGLIASRSMSCESTNAIKWHNISLSLDNAKFPHDQIPDYLPNTTSNWAYNALDWNSTYTAECTVTPETNITLEVVRNNNGSLWKAIPGLVDVLSDRFLNDKNNTEYNSQYQGTQVPIRDVWESFVFFSYAEFRPDADGFDLWDGVPTEHLSIHMSMTAMHDVPLTTDGEVGKGNIPRAWYTRVECDLTRKKPDSQYDFWESYLDQDLTTCELSEKMNGYFYASTIQPNADNSSTIALPNGNELFRFFQAYTLSKSTHFPHPVTRNITLRVPTVEVSLVFVIIMSLLVLVVLVGLIHCAICRYAYGELYSRVPETKVDWLLQSLREAETKGTMSHGPAQYYVAPNQMEEDYFSAGVKRKMPWEKARYSLSGQAHSPLPAPDGQPTPGTPSGGLGQIRVTRGNARVPSPNPSSLGSAPMSPPIPGPISPPAPAPFSSFMNHHNGYRQIPNPSPYEAPYGASSFASSPAVPQSGNDYVVSYGYAAATAQPIVNVGPRNDRGEWDVGIIDSRRS